MCDKSNILRLEMSVWSVTEIFYPPQRSRGWLSIYPLNIIIQLNSDTFYPMDPNCRWLSIRIYINTYLTVLWIMVHRRVINLLMYKQLSLINLSIYPALIHPLIHINPSRVSSINFRFPPAKSLSLISIVSFQ